MKIEKDYIANKKKYILSHLDDISSDIIKNELIDNDDCLEQFAKISLVVENLKTFNKFFYNKKRTEYMKECIYAQFKFKNDYDNTNIDNYLNFLDNNLNRLSVQNGDCSSYLGHKQKIVLKKSLANDARNFFQTFTHELMHCISHIDNDKKMGIGFGNISLLKYRRYASIDELVTETLQHKVLKKYFPYYINNDIPETIILKNVLNEEYKLEFNRSSSGYVAIMNFSNIIDNLYGQKLMSTYFSDNADCNIETEFDNYTINKFVELSQHYSFYGDMNADKSHDFVMYMSMQHIVSDLVVHYLQENNKTIDDVRNVILENPRYLINSVGKKINLNELLLEETERKFNQIQDVFIYSNYTNLRYYEPLNNIGMALTELNHHPNHVFYCNPELKSNLGFIKEYLKISNHESIISLSKDKILCKTLENIFMDDYNINKVINKLNNSSLTLQTIPQELLECKNTLLYIIEHTDPNVVTKENILKNIDISYQNNQDVINALNNCRNTEKKILLEL